MDEKIKFTKDVGWVFIGSIAALILKFLVKPVIARLLGVEGLGLYSLVLTLYSLLILFATLSIGSAITKYIAEYKGKKKILDQVISTSSLNSIILGTIAGIVLYFFSGLVANFFNEPELENLLRIFAIAFPFAAFSSIQLGVLNGLRSMNYYTLLSILATFSSTLFIIIFLIFGLGVNGAVVGNIFSVIFVCFIGVYLLRKYFSFDLNFIQNTKEILPFGIKMFGTDIINDINNRLDILLIGYFLAASDIGFYSAALSLTAFFSIIPMAIQRITYPATVGYWKKKNHKVLNKMIDKSIKYPALILMPIGLAVGFFAEYVIIFLFGQNFILSVLPLQILLIGTIALDVFARPIGNCLPGIGRPDLSMKISALTMVVGLLLSILLIPVFGIIGVALSMTMALITESIVSLVLIIKKLSIKIDIIWHLRMIGLVFIAIAIFNIGLWTGAINSYLLGGIVLFFFLAVLYFFFITDEDRTFFKSIICSLIHQK